MIHILIGNQIDIAYEQIKKEYIAKSWTRIPVIEGRIIEAEQ
tara:strand:+ start:471 stop:596 length:126 start_codon:yes stop_codon:yes gene_type:complete